VSFNSVVASFTTLLNRNDCTAAQANLFVQQAMNRIQREVRLPCMERLQVITSTGSLSQFPVPNDLLMLQDILVPGANDGTMRPLKKVPYRQLVRMAPTAWPTSYARFQNLFFIAGAVAAGTPVQVLYHGQFTAISDPTQDNEITASEPDMIVYAALSYAGDYFEHPNTDRWESKYEGIRESLKSLAEDLEMNGGPAAVQSMYNTDCDGE